MPLRLTLTSADALFTALSHIRPALRVLGPDAVAEIDGARFTIHGGLPGAVTSGPVEALVARVVAEHDARRPHSCPEPTEDAPQQQEPPVSVEERAKRIMEESPKVKAMAEALGLADAFAEVAPEIQPEAFRAAVVETAAPKPYPGQPWSGAEDQRLLELRRDGLSHKEIGERMGRSVKSIDIRVGKLRKAGVDLEVRAGRGIDPSVVERIKREREAGKTFPEIGAEMGLSGLAARLRLKRAEDEAAAEQPPPPVEATPEPGGSTAEGGRPYTPEEDATILAGRKAGRTFVEIGAEIDRSPDACRQRHGKLSGPEEAPSPRRNKLEDGEAEEIARLAGEGLTAAGIAERMGLTNRVVALSLSQSRKRAEAAQLRALVEAERAKAAAVVGSVDTSPDPLVVPADPVDRTASISEVVAPEPLTPEAESLPAIRVLRGVPFRQPAPSPLAAVTEAIQEVRRADKPVLGRLPAIEPPRSTKPGTSDLRRKIAAHLDALGHHGTWTALRDLDLFEGICAGRTKDTAARLDVSVEVAASRFRALSEPIRDPRKGNSPEGQILLAELLRERAATPAASPAMAAE